MDKIWDKKSFEVGHWPDEKNEWSCRTDKSRTLKKLKINSCPMLFTLYTIMYLLNVSPESFNVLLNTCIERCSVDTGSTVYIWW